ncbi:MAG TPA: TonB-dependent receptor [Acidobacteriaceae bacterium]|nr:TonB-dependent receptor [Acidobacteriaceae bacterium]
MKINLFRQVLIYSTGTLSGGFMALSFARGRNGLRTLAGVLLLGFLSVLFSGQAFAQASAALNGTVKDSTGAVIPGATLNLVEVNTHFKQTTRTSGTGVYNFTIVPPGHYTLQVAAKGFKTVVQPNFQLEVNQTSTINFALPVGSANTEVVVSAQSIVLETSTAELGNVVTGKEVNDLPLNGRNFTELLLLTPGASPVNPLQNKNGAPANIGSYVLPAVNGQSNRSNMFLLDGINNYANGSDSYAIQPTVDDILEFKAQSHNDEAQYGQVLGSIVNLVTRGGTNSFHGAAWEFFRDKSLDAIGYFNNPEAPFHQNQFGASIGGPVLLPHYNGHNKTFFYGSYEGYRLTKASSTPFNTPTAAQLTGDFSATPVSVNQIYNPYSRHLDTDPSDPANSIYINNPFYCDGSGNPMPLNADKTQNPGTPCNKLPAGLIDQNMVNYAKAFFPVPQNISIPGYNGQDNTPETTNANQFSIRIDEQLRARDRIFFRYTGEWQNQVASNGIPGNTNSNAIDGYNLAGNWTHTFDKGLIQVTFGHVKGTALTTPTLNGQAAFLQHTTFAPNFYNHDIGGVNTPLAPTVSVGGSYNLNDGNFIGGGSGGYTDITEYRTDDAYTFGRHQFKAGVSLATDNVDNKTIGSVDVFDVLQTSGTTDVGSGNPQTYQGGDALASMFLGLPTYAELDNVHAYLHSGKVFGSYIEDQWKLSGNLTLNIGLRYDITFWPQEGEPVDHSDITGDIDLNNGTYILQKPAPFCSATQSAPCIPGGALPAHVTVSPNGKIFHTGYGDIEPRFGFAYRLNDKTSIRGAYGRFYDNWAAVIGFSGNFTELWPNVAYFEGDNLNDPQLTVPNAFADDPLSVGSGNITPAATPFASGDGYLDPKLKNPHSDQYNIGFQRSYWRNSVLTVNYVGSVNHDEMVQITGNAATTPGPGDPSLRSPYPYIAPQTGYVRNYGSSNYNGLQISSAGRVGDFTHQVSYTYSKSLNRGCDTYSNVCDNQDPYNIAADYGPAGWNLKHIFATSLIYALPFGKGKRFATGNRIADFAIDGWQLNTIISLHSGSPYDVSVPTQIANTNNISGQERPNVVGNPYQGGTKLHPLNVNAFAQPSQFTFGDMGRNSLVSDWSKNIDLSLFRSVHLIGEKRLEFRVEAYNLTNTTVFAPPVNDMTDSHFGTVNAAANTARQLQLAAKFYF